MNVGPGAATSSAPSIHSHHSHHSHHQPYANGTTSPADMSRSTFPGTYYDPFYGQGAPTAWGAYPGPTYPGSQTTPQVVTSAANTCLLGPAGPKSLSSHFATVHSQRRKRRVLFTQTQVCLLFFREWATLRWLTLLMVDNSLVECPSLNHTITLHWFTRCSCALSFSLISLSPPHLRFMNSRDGSNNNATSLRQNESTWHN